MKVFVPALLLLLILSACDRTSSSAHSVRQFKLSGKVLGLNPAHQTATIDAAAIPNYMEAMTMEYPVKSKADFEKLHIGDQISATLDVQSDDSYTLTSVQAPAK